MSKKNLPLQGLVIFAKNKQTVSNFYQQTLGLKLEESDKTHDLLVGQGHEVVFVSSLALSFFIISS